MFSETYFSGHMRKGELSLKLNHQPLLMLHLDLPHISLNQK